MPKSNIPPVPPAGRNSKIPDPTGDIADTAEADQDVADPRQRNVDKQGRQGNINVNTTNQGYQQDR